MISTGTPPSPNRPADLHPRTSLHAVSTRTARRRRPEIRAALGPLHALKAELPEVASTLILGSNGSRLARQEPLAEVSELAGNVAFMADASEGARAAEARRASAEALEGRGRRSVAQPLRARSRQSLTEAVAGGASAATASVHLVADLPAAKATLGPIAGEIATVSGVTGSVLGTMLAAVGLARSAAALHDQLPAQRSRLEEICREIPGEGEDTSWVNRFVQVEDERLASLEGYSRIELARTASAALSSAAGALTALHLAEIPPAATMPLGALAVILGLASRHVVRRQRARVTVRAADVLRSMGKQADRGERTDRTDCAHRASRADHTARTEQTDATGESLRRIADYITRTAPEACPHDPVRPEDLTDEQAVNAALDLWLGPLNHPKRAPRPE